MAKGQELRGALLVWTVEEGGKAYECELPLEAERGQELDSSIELQKEQTLDLTKRGLWWISDLQNYKTINLYCLKPLNLQLFVTAVTEGLHNLVIVIPKADNNRTEVSLEATGVGGRNWNLENTN